VARVSGSGPRTVDGVRTWIVWPAPLGNGAGVGKGAGTVSARE